MNRFIWLSCCIEQDKKVRLTPRQAYINSLLDAGNVVTYVDEKGKQRHFQNKQEVKIFG